MLQLLDVVTASTGLAEAPQAGLLERLGMYREPADRRVAALRDRWTGAAGSTDTVHRHEHRLQHAREIH